MILKLCCCIPQRFVLALMIFLGFACEYMMRNLLSIAITQIVTKTYDESATIAGEFCPAPEDANNNTATDSDAIPSGTYEWSEAVQGVILSSFYMGYIITHIPGGVLVEKVGGKIMLLFGIVATSILTALTPLSISLGGSSLLIANRVVMGLCQGFIYASVFGLLSTWIPLRERTRLGAFVLSGITIGSVLSTYLSGILLKNIDGWEWPFYIYSIVGIIWCIGFALFCSKDPESNRFIAQNEKNYLRRELGMLERDVNLPPTPFKLILTSLPVWAIIVSQTGLDFSFYIMTSDLPKYFHDVMRMDVDKNGLYSSLPQIVYFISMITFGVVSDFVINNKYMSVRNTRRIFTTFGIFGVAVCFILASYSGCNQLLAVLFFSFTNGFSGIDNSRVNNMDLSPNYAPTIISIVNTCSSLMGILAPNIVGLLTPNSTILEWRIVFWIVFSVSIFSALFYFLFADGKVQSWNDPNKPKTNHNPADEIKDCHVVAEKSEDVNNSNVK